MVSPEGFTPPSSPPMGDVLIERQADITNAIQLSKIVLIWSARKESNLLFDLIRIA